MGAMREKLAVGLLAALGLAPVCLTYANVWETGHQLREDFARESRARASQAREQLEGALAQGSGASIGALAAALSKQPQAGDWKLYDQSGSPVTAGQESGTAADGWELPANFLSRGLVDGEESSRFRTAGGKSWFEMTQPLRGRKGEVAGILAMRLDASRIDEATSQVWERNLPRIWAAAVLVLLIGCGLAWRFAPRRLPMVGKPARRKRATARAHVSAKAMAAQRQG